MKACCVVIAVSCGVYALVALARAPVQPWQLTHAALHGDAATIRVAAAQGLDAAHDRDRLLCYAASRGDVHCARALLEMGAGPDVQLGGVTPLMLAAAGGHADVVRCLIERGADPSHRNRSNETALDLAVASGHADAAAVLRARGVS